MKGKQILLFILCAVCVFCYFVYYFHGYEAIWKVWSIPTMMPPFSDLRTILSGAEAHASGLDPLYDKPDNPYGAPMNYPRVWHYLSVFGMNQGHTVFLGSILIILFFIGVFIFVKQIDYITAIILSLTIFSPAVLFGLERGNNDLVVFIFLALALALSRTSTIISLSLILFSAILKVYPIVGLVYLLKENRKRFWTLLSISSAVFVAYFIYNLNDFLYISELTYFSSYMSYGMKILPRMVYGYLNSELLRDLASIFTYIFIILLFTVSFIFTCKNYEFMEAQSEDFIDAFRIGASIYIGTYIVIGQNWDYRLMFIIFTVPQLVSWTNKNGDRHSLVSKLTLAGILILCWHLVLWKRLPWETPILLFDEMFNWIVLSGLTFLFIASIPARHRNFIDRLIYQTPIIHRIAGSRRFSINKQPTNRSNKSEFY
jgi:hypothetical protein